MQFIFTGTESTLFYFSIQVHPGKLLKGPAMAWCEAHALLTVHKTNVRFISYLSIYIFIIYVKELTAIDWASVFFQTSTSVFAMWSAIFFEAITDISSDAESREEQYGASHF